MTELQRTGFFREMPHGAPGDPSLGEARNDAPAPHEDRIAAYLDAGRVYKTAAEPTRDVLAPGTSIGPPHLLTDGTFVWPGDLAHYVRTYHVRLAGPFIEHMLASGWTVPADIDLATLTLPAGTVHESDLGKAVSDFLGAARDALNSPDGEKLRAQLSAMGSAASRFLQSLAPPGSERRKRIAEEKELFKTTINEVTTDAARAASTVAGDLRGTLEHAGERARGRLSSSLRALSDWLEKPHEERSAQVQSFMSSLHTKLDEAVARQREAEGARREPPSDAGQPPHEGEPHEPGTDPGDKSGGN